MATPPEPMSHRSPPSYIRSFGMWPGHHPRATLDNHGPQDQQVLPALHAGIEKKPPKSERSEPKSQRPHREHIAVWSWLERCSDPVSGDDFPVPECALLEDAPLGGVVNVDEAPPFSVALLPLEIVH